MKKIILLTLILAISFLSGITTTQAKENPEELNITLNITGINVERGAGALIYYDKTSYKNGKSPANGWGYEVSVNKDGYIVEVSANVSGLIDGFILSGHGDNKTALMKLAVGDKVIVDLSTKKATITRTFKESMFAKAKINYDKAVLIYEESENLCIDYDKEEVERVFEEITTSYELISKLSSKETLTDDDRNLLIENVDLIAKNYEKLIYLTSPTSNIDLRAVWHRPRSCAIDENTLDGVKTFLKRVKECGFNVIFLETYWNGYFTGVSEIVDTHPRVRNLNMGEYGNDYLKAFITEAAYLGIDVHAWCHTFNAGSTSYLSSNIKEEWLLETYTGVKLHPNEYSGAYYLDPSNDEVINYMANIYIEMMENYDFKGLQLDYIRYWDNDFNQTPYRDSGYGELSENKFLRETGLSGDVKEIVKTVSGREKWNAWRCENITKAVEKLSSAVKSVNKDLIVSAAVVSNPSQAKSTYMQDLQKWAKNGYIDLFCPMIYTGSVDQVERFTIELVSLVNEMSFVSSGIAPLYYGYSNETNHAQMVCGTINSIGTSYFASHNIFTSKGELTEAESSIINGVYRNNAVNPLTINIQEVLDVYYNSLESILNRAKGKENISDTTTLQSIIDSAKQILPSSPKEYNDIITQLGVLKVYSSIIEDENIKNEFIKLLDEMSHYLNVKINRYLTDNKLWNPATEQRPNLNDLPKPNDYPVDTPTPPPASPSEDGCTKGLLNVIGCLVMTLCILITFRKIKKY